MADYKNRTLKDYKVSFTYGGPDGIVSRINEYLGWEEANAKVQREAGVTEEKPYRGTSEADTSLTQRIAKATFQPSNNTAYRTQEIINSVLKAQQARLKEERAANRAYARQMQDYL